MLKISGKLQSRTVDLRAADLDLIGGYFRHQIYKLQLLDHLI